MPVGIETYDALGKILLSSDVLTMALRRTGTGITIASDAGMTVPSMVKLPFLQSSYTWPLVAISCDSTVGMLGLGTDGYMRYACSGTVGTAYTYYLFDVSTTIPDTGLGLEVYNAAGQRSFSASQRALKPLTIFTETRTRDTGAAYPTATYAGKQLAMVIPHWAGWRYWPPLGTCYDGGGAGTSWEPGSFCSNLEISQDYKILGGKITNGGQTASIDDITFEDVDISTSSTEYSSHVNLARPLTAIVADVTLYPVPATVF